MMALACGAGGLAALYVIVTFYGAYLEETEDDDL
jgi:hypothetical protein